MQERSLDQAKVLMCASMVLSIISLFVAISGVAVAGSADQEITSADIKNGTIKSVDIANNTVGSTDIKNGAVDTQDLHKEAVDTADMAVKSVKTSILDEEAVTTSRIADAAVEKEQLANLAVTNEKLQQNAVTSSKIEDGTIFVSDFAKLPHVIASRSTTQSVPEGALGAEVGFDTEEYETGPGEIHSTSTKNGRFFAPVAGIYTVDASVTWAANATGWRRLQLWKGTPGSGAIPIDSEAAVATDTQPAVGVSQGQVISQQVHLDAGQWLDVKAAQSSGGALNLEAGSSFTLLQAP